MKLAETRARENNYSELRLATHILLTENIKAKVVPGSITIRERR